MDLGQFQAQERGFCVTILCSFSCICRLLWACILRETSIKSLGIFDCLLSLSPSADRPSPGLLSQSDRPPQLSVVDCPLWVPLSTAFCPFWDLPLLIHFRSCGRSRAQALCLGFAPKQTKRFSDRRAPAHSVTECHWLIFKVGPLQSFCWYLND